MAQRRPHTVCWAVLLLLLPLPNLGNHYPAQTVRLITLAISVTAAGEVYTSVPHAVVPNAYTLQQHASVRGL